MPPQDSLLPISRTAKASPWPARIAATLKVRDVRISPDGSRVLYQVQAFYKSDRTLSELWLAQTDVQNSSRPLTNGMFNDKAGVFHPDGSSVMFLSDRHDPGKSMHIYTLDLNLERVNLKPVRVADFGKRGVQGFKISPDGRFIAFTSADEKACEEEEQKTQQRDDAHVFGENNMTMRLRVYHSETGAVSTMEEIRKDGHMESYTWSPDSRQLLYRLRRGRGPEYAEQEVILERIPVDLPRVPIVLGSYPRSPSGQDIWLSSGQIASLQSYDPRNSLDARTLFVHHIDEPFGVLQGTDRSRRYAGPEQLERHDRQVGERDDGKQQGIARECQGSNNRHHRLYGDREDAVRIVNMAASSGDSPDGVMIAIEVSSDVETHIDAIAVEEGRMGAVFTLFQTKEDAVWFGAWDARRAVDNIGNLSYVCAAVLSSGVRHEPPNVWACRVAGSEQHEMSSGKIKLSSHLQWLADAPVFRTEVIRWKATDGTELSGLVRYPPGYEASHGLLPTVLFIHGGPYRCVKIRLPLYY
jgi:hypothetical protein